ncbi:creatininase family protein [Anatilimnocola aggregata]|nr:creatininase family protein [Anatilimnocola aggregata]
MNWPAVAALPKTTPVVIPIAAIEQHGHHMPVFTDSLLLGEVIRRAHEQLKTKVLFTPLMWLGNSEHHIDFAGTMTAAPRVYLDLLSNLIDNMITHGFQRIVLVNGHGGNHVPGQQVVFELRQKHRQRNDLLLLNATYWLLGGKPYELDSALEQRRMGHACEWETSMMLRIRPDLVTDLNKTVNVDFGNPFEPGSRGWITKERTPTGHIGDPRKATAEKGETLFSVFTADVVTYIERMLAWDGKSWNG